MIDLDSKPPTEWDLSQADPTTPVETEETKKGEENIVGVKETLHAIRSFYKIEGRKTTVDELCDDGTSQQQQDQMKSKQTATVHPIKSNHTHQPDDATTRTVNPPPPPPTTPQKILTDIDSTISPSQSSQNSKSSDRE
jgi:hypothetical protein